MRGILIYFIMDDSVEVSGSEKKMFQIIFTSGVKEDRTFREIMIRQRERRGSEKGIGEFPLNHEGW